MNKLEESARKHAGITPDVIDVKNLRDLRTISARKSLQRYDSFVKGAEWQKNNMWIRIDDRENVIPNDKDILIRMSNGEVRRYNEDWESEFALDGIVTHWMPIPEIKKGE